MNRIIVNADDCGYSSQVNDHIRNAIKTGKVTSTTIIVNKDDYDGAVRLYDDFHKDVSFGIHLNLTEGEPLTKSSVLLECGFYKEVDGRVVLNGNSFRYRLLPNYVKEAIKAELCAQVKVMKDCGIDISHIDSHHHIHTSPVMLPIVLQVARENSINAIRRAGDNFMHGSRLYRKLWMAGLRHCDKQIRTTEHFWGFDEFFGSNLSENKLINDSTIELMTHPGGKYHPEEETMLLDGKLDESRYSLINYNTL